MELAISLDPQSAVPLHRQLYEALGRAILGGRLAPGERLPATRALAESLAVSRTTVSTVYDQLLAEGYLEARVGAGTFVCDRLPDDMLRAEPGDGGGAPTKPMPLSAWGARLAEVGPLRGRTADAPIAFSHFGRPALDAFPLDTWRRLLARQSRPGHARLGYAEDAGGEPALREAVASYLARSRAVRCAPDQVVIVNGSQQGLDLIARLLLDPGDGVALEEPGYLGARSAFAAHGARLHPIPVDAAGLVVDRLPTTGVKLAHVTPSHQFPTGAVLPMARRLALLAWAKAAGAVIVEDDYDSEYRYGDRPMPSLQGLDRDGVVVYVGTFSKMLFPALRLGYLVLPPGWAPLVAKAKWLADRHGPWLEQRALADFIQDGHLERHLRRMRALYGRRRACLIAALAEAFGDAVTILGDHAGMHLTIRLDVGWGAEAIAERALACGVGVATTRACYMGEPPPAELVLGYADLAEEAIREGVRRLALACRNGEG